MSRAPGPAHSSSAGTTSPVVLPDCEGPTTSTDARGSAAISLPVVHAERHAPRLGLADVQRLQLAARGEAARARARGACADRAMRSDRARRARDQRQQARAPSAAGRRERVHWRWAAARAVHLGSARAVLAGARAAGSRGAIAASVAVSAARALSGRGGPRRSARRSATARRPAGSARSGRASVLERPSAARGARDLLGVLAVDDRPSRSRRAGPWRAPAGGCRASPAASRSERRCSTIQCCTPVCAAELERGLVVLAEARDRQRAPASSLTRVVFSGSRAGGACLRVRGACVWRQGTRSRRPS